MGFVGGSRLEAMRLRPLEDLLEQQLVAVASGVLEACEGVPEATTAILTARDRRKRTVLHLAATQGNTQMARLFLTTVKASPAGSSPVLQVYECCLKLLPSIV